MAAATESKDATVGGGSTEDIVELLPSVDIELWLKYQRGTVSKDIIDDECAKVAQALHKYGAILVKDPRARSEDNDKFLDMIENYFGQPEEEVMKDVRPDLSFQVGATPSFTELPRNHCDKMKAFKDRDTPLSLCPPERDPKMRFFWRLGKPPKDTEFSTLNADAVVPAEFPEWRSTMDTWGATLLAGVTSVAEMLGEGLGIGSDTLPKMLNKGPHLLAPTASDLKKFGKDGTVLAGFHYDLNFMTIHGRSRYPGLYIWRRDGKKLLVRVPDKHLLLQAGKQLEYITGGYIMAGYHEVVVCKETMDALARAKAAGRSEWRISSTCFGALQSDLMLQPLDKFSTEETLKKYPPIKVGAQVQAELDHIKLGGADDREKAMKKAAASSE